MSQERIRLGSTAPDFEAESTLGPISFHKYIEGSWAILFSHPADFTPVCTTELGTVQKLKGEFEKRNVKVLGVSVDSLQDHNEWIKDINQVNKVDVNFPILVDKERKISTLYDMLDTVENDATNFVNGLPLTVRSVFIIDPSKKVRLTLTYPASCGRNFNEIIRVVDSLQLSDKHPITTPANWNQGDNVIIHPKITDQEADTKFPGYQKVTPYLRFTQQP
ncbi:putative thioredoxin peroxidase [Neoconidiobolus thromboides FSU 785]|nr:putative thioredoxin peroxidase [Neoconidiobolus thromboides FSU 785]